MPPEPSGESRVDSVLRLLSDEVRARLARHPQGHLLAAGGDRLELTLSLPAAARNGRLAEAGEQLEAELARAIDGALAHRAAFRPGRVFCLRCGGADCEHAAPGDSRQVFAGYGKTGLPRFTDFGQLLLERGDPRVDRLYAGNPALLAHTLRAGELTGELLAAYRDSDAGYRLHGQVAAGWYRVPDPATGRPAVVAVSLQVVSTRPAGGGRRFGLNVLGTAPGGEPIEHLHDRLGEIPWQETVRWAQTALDGIARKTGRGRRQAETPLQRRLDGLLDGIARRLEKSRRARDRRTLHAQERHAGGDRPTAMALADLARAADDRLLVDTRRKTLVVLGARGRAHLFNRDGKLVTSVRYNPASIERRKQRRLWRPARRDEIETLRLQVKTGGG